MSDVTSRDVSRRVAIVARFSLLARRLTTPLVPIDSFEDRQKAQWMAAVLLGLMPVGIVLSLAPEFLSPSGRPFWQHTELATVGILLASFMPFYFLSRLGHYRIVAWLAVGSGILAIWTALIQDTDAPSKMFDASMLIMPLLFGSTMFGRRGTVVIGSVILLSLLAVPFVVPGVTHSQILSGPFNILFIGGGLSYLGTFLRDSLERFHTATLTETNATLQLEIKERQRIEEQINLVLHEKNALLEEKERSLQEKEVLLKEIHHRVKNNLQVVSSLLNLQSAKIRDPLLQADFQDSKNRIYSMALIHEQLYRSEDLAHIDFGIYLRELICTLMQTYQRQGQAITASVEVEQIWLGIDAAIPCGLLVNELVSNALKHGFPDGRSGAINVNLSCVEPDKYQLLVSDNGIGFPAEIDFRVTSSLGLRLVNSLVRQLGGSITMRNVPGTIYTVDFGGSAADTLHSTRSLS